MTPHERALLTIKALEIRRKKKQELIDNYESEKRVRMYKAKKKRVRLDEVR